MNFTGKRLKRVNWMEELNGNIHYQMFCDILIDPTHDPGTAELAGGGVEKGYELMCEASQKLGIHRPRTKYLDVEKANLTYRKQRNHFQSGDARESIPDRIVSIAKPYVGQS